MPPSREKRSTCSLLRARLQVSRRKWERFQGLPRTFGQALADARSAFPPRSDSSAARVPSHAAPPGARTPLPLVPSRRHTGALGGAQAGARPRCGVTNTERSGERAAPGGARAGTRGPCPDWGGPLGALRGLTAPPAPAHGVPAPARPLAAPRPPAPGSPSLGARPVPEKSARAATSAPHTRTTQDRRRRSRPGSTCARRGCSPASPSLMVRERAARPGGAAPLLHMVQPVPAGGAAPPGPPGALGAALAPRGRGGRGRSSPGSGRRGHSGRGAAAKGREGTEGPGRAAGSRRRRAGHCPRRASCGRPDSEPAAPRPPSPALPTPLRALRASLLAERLDVAVCSRILAWQWTGDCHGLTHTVTTFPRLCFSRDRCSPPHHSRSPAAQLLCVPCSRRRRPSCQTLPSLLLQPRSCPYISAHGSLREPSWHLRLAGSLDEEFQWAKH